MEKVVVTKPFGDPSNDGIYALCYMQVCAEKEATDEEILDVCRRENPCGTEKGWTTVVRETQDPWVGPVQCADDPERLHILVLC